MGNNKIFKLVYLTVILLLFGGLSLGVFAQGKGRGGGGGNGGGNGHGNGGGWEKHGGGQPGNGNGRWGGNPAPQQPAQMPQMQNRGWQQRQVIIQPQAQPQQNRGWQVERRQQQVNRNAERQAWRQQQPRQNPIYVQPAVPRWSPQARSAPQMVWRAPSKADWKTERRANKEYLKGIRKEQREMARVPQYQAPVYAAPQQPYIPRYQSRSQGSYGESYSYQPRQYQTYQAPNYREYAYQPPIYQNYAYAPQYNGSYGYAPQYGGNYGTNSYIYESYLPYANRSYSDYSPYYYDDLNYNRNTSWKYQLLGMVLQAFLGGRDGNGGYDANYGDQYAYYGGSPTYNGYPTHYATYRSAYNGYGYQSNGYGNTDNDTGLFDTVPFFGLTDDFPGGFGNELTMQTLSYGYDQGYYAGQYCKRHRITEDNFYDPYYFEDAGYDPYSVSIGENRRYLSEGYELGFRDGYQAGRRHYDPADEGDVDLVSLLLNNVLSAV